MRYLMYRGRACWSVVGHGKANGVLGNCGLFSGKCASVAPSRYLTAMCRGKGGLKIRAFMNWF